MSKVKLLPCPFCGGEAELQKGMCELDNYVMCLECRSKTKLYNTKESAIKKWNTRKPIQDIVERLEEIEEKALRVQNYDVSFYATGQIHKAIEIVKEVGEMNEK